MLEKLFDEENAVYRLIDRIADMFVLNLLFIASCIPVVTIGPALTALYYVGISAWDRDDGHIFKMYFKSFKQNFKQALIIWLILLPAGIVLGAETWMWISQWRESGEPFHMLMVVLSVIILQGYLLIFTYAWPLQAKFSNRIGATLKNALVLGISHIPSSLGLWILFAGIMLFCYMVDFTRVSFVLIAFALTAYLQALIFRHVFKPYMEETKMQSETED